jgi:hypothetical protein
LRRRKRNLLELSKDAVPAIYLSCWRNIAITLIDAGVQSAHGLLETNFGRTLRFRSHLFLLSHLDSFKGHISRSGTRNNWFDRRGRRRDLCFAFTCLLGTGDNRVWRGILPVSGGLKDQLGGRETPNNFCRTIVVGETSPLHSQPERAALGRLQVVVGVNACYRQPVQ